MHPFSSHRVLSAFLHPSLFLFLATLCVRSTFLLNALGNGRLSLFEVEFYFGK